MTTPEIESTDAINGAFETHLPPLLGDNEVVEPIHILFEPEILTVGLALTNILMVSPHEVVEYIYLYVPAAAFVKDTVAVPPLPGFKVLPVGFPGTTAHVPVVGSVPARFAMVPAHTD